MPIRNTTNRCDDDPFKFCRELNSKNCYGGDIRFHLFSALSAKNSAGVTYVGVVGIDVPELTTAACERDSLALPN